MFVIAGLIIAIAVATLVGLLTLGQVQKSAQRAQQPVQFFLTDFAWLLVQLQVVLALVTRYDFGAVWAWRMVAGFAAGALIAMWWGAVRALSQAGVRGTFRRAVFILLLLPAVEASMIVAAMLFGIFPQIAFQAANGRNTNMMFGFEWPVWLVIGVACAAMAGLALACWGLNWLTKWVLAEPALGSKPRLMASAD